MPPRKKSNNTTTKKATPPPTVCPAIPKKIEVSLTGNNGKKSAPPPTSSTEEEVVIKDLRSRLRKSQLRVREMEKVLTSSLISMVNTHPLMTPSLSTAPAPPTTTTAPPPQSSSEEEIATKAAQIVQTHSLMQDRQDIESDKRMLRELEGTLDIMDKKMNAVRKKARGLNQRYSRIEASINRELWKARIQGDTDRLANLETLQREQETKYRTMSQTFSDQIQTLTLEKDNLMAKHESTDTSLQQSVAADAQFRKAVRSLGSDLHSFQR